MTYRSALSTQQGGPDWMAMMDVALEQARLGLEEGGVPIGAALFDAAGCLLGAGRNQRVQDGDPSVHAETDAFRRAGRQRSYRDTIMVTTLAPCWYCSGLVRQFGIGTVVIAESRNFAGGAGWLAENGVRVVDLHLEDSAQRMAAFIQNAPHLWNEDIGQI